MSSSPARPTGITILAVLAGIGGVLNLLAGFGLLFGGAFLLGAGTGYGGAAALFGIAFLALGGLLIALAYGFWMTLPWAWPLGVILELVNIGLAIAGAVVSGNFVSSLVGQAICDRDRGRDPVLPQPADHQAAVRPPGGLSIDPRRREPPDHRHRTTRPGIPGPRPCVRHRRGGRAASRRVATRPASQRTARRSVP